MIISGVCKVNLEVNGVMKPLTQKALKFSVCVALRRSSSTHEWFLKSGVLLLYWVIRRVCQSFLRQHHTVAVTSFRAPCRTC